MSFLDVRVLRFDERIEIKNKEVTSDNPNGKNGIVISLIQDGLTK
jgi:hypothetical protein